jgi:hypothetical protein
MLNRFREHDEVNLDIRVDFYAVRRAVEVIKVVWPHGWFGREGVFGVDWKSDCRGPSVKFGE